MPIWLEAGLWGLLASGSLLIGAAVAWFVRLPLALIATIMAFGAGVLISALSFELVEDAVETGGFLPTAAGVLAGGLAYTAANAALARRGARRRKDAGGEQPSEREESGSGTAIAVGALLDGVPESVVLGISLIGDGVVSLVVLGAIFISNFPEGLSSAAGMRRAGRSATYVFGVWTAIVVISGVSAAVGAGLLQGGDPAGIAAITGVAAGAILAMIASTMIPEAFERAALSTGLVTVLGFLAAFGLQQAGG